LSTAADDQTGWVEARCRHISAHHMHRRPHPQRWVVSAIATDGACRDQRQRRAWCQVSCDDAVHSSSCHRNSHLHFRACAVTHVPASLRGSLGPPYTTPLVPSWQYSLPCGRAALTWVNAVRGEDSRIEMNSRHNAVTWAVMWYIRSRTTLEGVTNNDTLLR